MRQGVSYTTVTSVQYSKKHVIFFRPQFKPICLKSQFIKRCPWRVYSTATPLCTPLFCAGLKCFFLFLFQRAAGCVLQLSSASKTYFLIFRPTFEPIFFKSQFITCCAVEGVQYATPLEKPIYWARLKFLILFLFLREAGCILR